MKSWWKAGKAPKDPESGQAMVEFAIVFPLQLLITLLIIQVTLIMVGKQVVNYAAFSAARAEIVGEDAEAAAATVCSTIAGTVSRDDSEEEVFFPGWTEDKRPDLVTLSRRARDKVRVYFDERPDDGTGRVVTRLNFDFEMSMPFVGWVIYYGLDAISPGLVHIKGLEETAGPDPSDELAVVIKGMPHIILKEKAVLAAPWGGDESSQRPHEFIEEFEEVP